MMCFDYSNILYDLSRLWLLDKEGILPTSAKGAV